MLAAHHAETTETKAEARSDGEARAGDGLPGLDFISGWNCDPKKNGCSGISHISIRSPLVPENTMPLS